METITYTIFSGTITKQQAEQQEEYEKLYWIDGKIKKVEAIKRGLIISIDYYISDEESELEIVPYLIDQTSSVKYVVLYRTLNVLGNYRKKTRKFYEKGILKGYSRSLKYIHPEFPEIDNEEYENQVSLCDQSLDVITGAPIAGECLKNCANDTYTYCFDYNLDGSFMSVEIIDNDDPNERTIYYDFEEVVDFGFWETGTIINPNYFRTNIFDPTGFEV